MAISNLAAIYSYTQPKLVFRKKSLYKVEQFWKDCSDRVYPMCNDNTRSASWFNEFKKLDYSCFLSLKPLLKVGIDLFLGN